MATLLQFEALLSSNASIVKWIDPNQDFGFYKFYTIYYTTSTQTTIGIPVVDSRAICIYIQDRGLPTEAVSFKSDIPPIFNVPQTTPFLDAVKAGIAAFQTSNPNVEKVEIVSSDENQKVSICNAYVTNAGTTTKKMVAIYYVGTTLTYRLLA